MHNYNWQFLQYFKLRSFLCFIKVKLFVLLLCICAILPGKAIPKMTYTVSGWTLNPTHSLTPPCTKAGDAIICYWASFSKARTGNVNHMASPYGLPKLAHRLKLLLRNKKLYQYVTFTDSYHF